MTVYINDIVEISKVMELILFADDTNISMIDESASVLNDRFNSELCKIFGWFKNK